MRRINIPSLQSWALDTVPSARVEQDSMTDCSAAKPVYSSKTLKPGWYQSKAILQPPELPPFQDLALDFCQLFSTLFSLSIKKVEKNQTSSFFLLYSSLYSFPHSGLNLADTSQGWRISNCFLVARLPLASE